MRNCFKCGVFGKRPRCVLQDSCKTKIDWPKESTTENAIYISEMQDFGGRSIINRDFACALLSARAYLGN